MNPLGEIAGHRLKTFLTYNELSKGFSHGDDLHAISTDFGLVGVAICYEVHFPEVVRSYALQGEKIIFNPIGTGMWNETQFAQWTAAGFLKMVSLRLVAAISTEWHMRMLPMRTAWSRSRLISRNALKCFWNTANRIYMEN